MKAIVHAYGGPTVTASARLVGHADWSAAPAGRALVVAERRPAGRGWWLRLEDPGRVAELSAEPRALLGFDAPIGLPEAYARARGIGAFRAFLAQLRPDDPLLEPVAPPERPSLARPFYPRRPGGARRADLVEGLGLGPFERLLRRCDRLAGAHCLFWTLGPRQCGRAALALWRELLLAPRPPLALWPFEGRLLDLLDAGRAVVAETYPGLAYRLLGLGRGFGKASPAGRLGRAERLAGIAAELGARLEAELARELADGFPRTRDHGFDALVGCLLLLAVVTGRLPGGEPVPAPTLAVEGWMLGLEPAAGEPSPRGDDAGPGGRAGSRSSGAAGW